MEALSESGRQTAENQPNRIVSGVRYAGKANLVRCKYSLIYHEQQKVAHATPELAAHQDQRKRTDLPALQQSGCFKQFVKRTQPTRQNNVGARVLDQHNLANEEIAEFDVFIDVSVRFLLVWKNNVKSVGGTASLTRTAVCRLHRSRPTACNHR